MKRSMTPSHWAKHLVIGLTMTGTAICLSACGSGEQNVESVGQVLQNGQLAPQLKGAWRVLGEGRLIEVSDKTITQYQETNSICYLDRHTISTELLQGFSFRQSIEPQHVKVDLYPTANAPSKFTLERISEIPANCRTDPPTDPETTFKTMWEIFNLDYAFFKERQIDWQSRFTALASQAAQAKDDDALEAVLVDALHDFNDEHVTLIRSRGDDETFEFSASNTPTMRMLKQAFSQQHDILDPADFEDSWKNALHESMRSSLAGGSNGRVLNGAMIWGKLPGNIGYIEISRMFGFAQGANLGKDVELIRAEMDRAILGLADAKAIIVDIAVNDGGYDHVSAEIAGSFADMRRLAFTVRQHRPQGREAQSWFIEPKGPRQYLKPVYLLTTDRTVSAGDTLTLMMRELPHVTHIGQATSGSMSDKLDKSLPGNFTVSLSNEIYADPRGVVYEGRGIPPKVPLVVFDPADPSSLYSGHDNAINKLIEIIRSK